GSREARLTISADTSTPTTSSETARRALVEKPVPHATSIAVRDEERSRRSMSIAVPWRKGLAPAYRSAIADPTKGFVTSVPPLENHHWPNESFRSVTTALTAVTGSAPYTCGNNSVPPSRFSYRTSASSLFTWISRTTSPSSKSPYTALAIRTT